MVRDNEEDFFFSFLYRDFVEEKLGSKYVIGRSMDFSVSFEESGPATPMFFILSPGVDPLKDVEKHGEVFLSSSTPSSELTCWGVSDRYERRGCVPLLESSDPSVTSHIRRKWDEMEKIKVKVRNEWDETATE